MRMAVILHQVIWVTVKSFLSTSDKEWVTWPEKERGMQKNYHVPSRNSGKNRNPRTSSACYRKLFNSSPANLFPWIATFMGVNNAGLAWPDMYSSLIKMLYTFHLWNICLILHGIFSYRKTFKVFPSFPFTRPASICSEQLVLSR